MEVSLMEHECKHEVDLALTQAAVTRMEKTLEELCVLLRGNGEGTGLKGKIDKFSASVKVLYGVTGAVALALCIAVLGHIFGVNQ